MTSVVVIVGIFFVIGITVGIIAVVAMSAARKDRRGGPDDWPGAGPARPDEQPPNPDWDSAASDDRPWWKSRDGE